ncbi:TPA: protein-serine/threonine phosphatase [Citrobacter koseri]|uniref:protein-serine/threonine phosphatase n=1 Tax=Citrobacter koseri TaxID=545 RepID=UPI001904E055|nr:protein-serine/threonine phosphatase [Citrobacter koseri]MBJ9354491.1 protein-serine/threonine phosphatase [Citrobacter koseri]HBL7007325.1 protein-serine/threonine phosphatase [Citrobacter koseri]
MKQPENVYQKIEGSQWRHVWIVGDLHGCFSQLMEKLRQCRFDPWQDLLVSVGDVIDRGPDSLRCLELLHKRWVVAVRGNHEQMALDALAASQLSLWFMNGGDWYDALSANQQRLARKALDDCQRLPWILELHCQNGMHVVAHADYPHQVYAWQKEVDLHQVLWRRSRLSERHAGQGNGIAGADHFWFGHTPLRHRVDIDNLHYIDTGAVFGGELTLVQLQ